MTSSFLHQNTVCMHFCRSTHCPDDPQATLGGYPIPHCRTGNISCPGIWPLLHLQTTDNHCYPLTYFTWQDKTISLLVYHYFTCLPHEPLTNYAETIDISVLSRTLKKIWDILSLGSPVFTSNPCLNSVYKRHHHTNNVQKPISGDYIQVQKPWGSVYWQIIGWRQGWSCGSHQQGPTIADFLMG